jgi:hypothetical protein
MNTGLALALGLLSLACTPDRTADGRVIRHTCVEGHYQYIPTLVGKMVMLVPVYVCDRECLDTLPGEGER